MAAQARAGLTEKDKRLLTVFDSGHDFLLGSRVTDEDPNNVDFKRAILGTILLDYLQDYLEESPNFTAFPSKENAGAHVAIIREKIREASGTAFEEDAVIKKMEEKYLWLGRKTGETYPKIAYKDLQDPDSAAYKKAISLPIVELPREAQEEKISDKLEKIRKFIAEFYWGNTESFQVSPDAAPQNVFSSFLKDPNILIDKKVQFLVNWATSFDPSGGLSKGKQGVVVADNVTSRSPLPGADYTTWLAKRLKPGNDASLTMNVKSSGNWDPDVSASGVKIQIGDRLWYQADPDKKSPGVPNLSRLMILQEQQKAAGGSPGEENPEVLRSNLQTILQAEIAGSSPRQKDARRRYYIASFLDLKEAGDRAQIDWVDANTLKAEDRILFLTNDRLCSLHARVIGTVHTANCTAANAYLFKGKKIYDPRQYRYAELSRLINEINYFYGFAAKFADAPFFQQILVHLSSFSTRNHAQTVPGSLSTTSLSYLIPSLFVFAHAIERFKDYFAFYNELKSKTVTIQEKLEEWKGTILENNLQAFIGASQEGLQYFTQPPLSALKDFSDESLDTFIAALKNVRENPIFQDFEEAAQSLNFSIIYTGDTVKIEGQTNEDTVDFLRAPDVNKGFDTFLFSPEESALFGFYTTDRKRPRYISTSIVNLKESIDAFFAPTKDRYIPLAVSKLYKELGGYAEFFGDDTTKTTYRSLLTDFNNFITVSLEANGGKDDLKAIRREALLRLAQGLESIIAYMFNNASQAAATQGGQQLQTLATIDIQEALGNGALYKAFLSFQAARDAMVRFVREFPGIVSFPTPIEKIQEAAESPERKALFEGIKRGGKRKTRKQRRSRQRGGADLPHLLDMYTNFILDLNTFSYKTQKSLNDMIKTENKLYESFFVKAMEEFSQLETKYFGMKPLRFQSSDIDTKIYPLAGSDKINISQLSSGYIAAYLKGKFGYQRVVPSLSYNTIYGYLKGIGIQDCLDFFGFTFGINTYPAAPLSTEEEISVFLRMALILKSLHYAIENYFMTLATSHPVPGIQYIPLESENLEETQIINALNVDIQRDQASPDLAPFLQVISTDVPMVGNGRRYKRTRKQRHKKK